MSRQVYISKRCVISLARVSRLVQMREGGKCVQASKSHHTAVTILMLNSVVLWSGRVDERELRSSFERLGVSIGHDEAKRLLQR